MKNYIANERGDWATSAAYIKFSLARSIHYGRMYTHGGDRKGNEDDLCEALRCLGQGLHTLEDFAAHTNYIELALREMGFHNVFPHTGTSTQINLHGHRVFPLVTGTFGMVDFFHSVLGEATDHFTQSEVNEMDIALGDAQANSSGSSIGAFTGLLGKIPGTKELVMEAEDLKRQSDAQNSRNQQSGSRSGYGASHGSSRGLGDDMARASESGHSSGGGMQDFDPKETIAKIYPILQFRDKVVRRLSGIIEKIPGLETVVEKISETLTVFIMSLLAPFIRPVINLASQSLQTGSAGVIDASGKHQYEPWTDPSCTDPTHSLLSKDHFSNILNEPAGQVASAILQYVAPRVLYAWEHVDVHDQEVLADCLRVFHHPALRDMNNDAHRTMFEAVKSWAHSRPGGGSDLNDILSSEGVKSGKNNGGEVGHSHGGGGHSHGGGGFSAMGGAGQRPPQQQPQQQQQSSSGGSGLPWEQLSKLPIPGISKMNKLSSLLGGGATREVHGGSEGHSSHEHHAGHSTHGGYAGSNHSHSSHHGAYQPQPSFGHASHGHTHGHNQHEHQHQHQHHHQHHQHQHHSHQPHHNHGSGGYGGGGYGHGGYQY
ncbi:hypothetical protein AWENTII_007706 [Aspergillus wentii]